MDERADDAIDDAARVISSSKYVVALVGAGLSAESGVPTFRGPEGLWTKQGEPDLRDYDRFREDPAKWWEMRIARTSQFSEMIHVMSTMERSRRGSAGSFM